MKRLLIFLIILWLVPLWCFQFLPFVDLPQHLAIAHILHNYNNPLTFDYSQFFSLRFFPRAHIVHTLFLHWASYVMPLEIAGKVFISLIVILLPVSIYQFIKVIGGNRWFTLLSFFFIYNYNLIWGFIAYCLGIALFFFGLSLAIKLKEGPEDKRRPKIGFSLILLLALLVHFYIYILVVFSFLLINLWGNLKLRQVLGKLLIILPSFIFLAFCAYPIWRQRQESGLSNISNFLPAFSIIKGRLLNLGGYLFAGRPGDKWLFGFVLAVFLSLIILRIIQARADKSSALSSRERPLNILAGILVLLYLFLPTDALRMHNLVAQRLAVLIPLLLIGPLSRVRLKYLPSLIVVTLVVLGILFASLLSGFRKFDAQARPLRALLEKTQENKRLVELYTYPGDSGFFFHSFLHFGCYYTIWKNGLCGFIFPQAYNFFIVEVKKEASLPYITVFDSWNCVFPRGWENFDYFLVCGRPSLENERWLEKAQLRLLGQEGIWRLYRK